MAEKVASRVSVVVVSNVCDGDRVGGDRLRVVISRARDADATTVAVKDNGSVSDRFRVLLLKVLLSVASSDFPVIDDVMVIVSDVAPVCWIV